MRAVDGFLAVFAEGHEHVKALVAGVADKVIGWHESILTETSPGVESDVVLWDWLPRWG